jgi:hypothetical protein
MEGTEKILPKLGENQIWLTELPFWLLHFKTSKGEPSILKFGYVMGGSMYEFNTSQNQLIKDLADKMRFVAYFLIGLGILLTIAGLVALRGGGIANIIQGVIQIIIGFWTSRAANSFRSIVKTQGNDIGNLMSALEELRKLYTLQYWLLIVALILVAIGFIFALVVGITGGLS